MGKLQDYPYIPSSSLTGEDKLLIIRNKSQGLIKLSDLPANIPSDLKAQMNNIFNKKFKTRKSYSPDTWSATVNLMEKLIVKTLTGSTISFLDGADDVPLKSCVIYIPASQNALSWFTITHTDGNNPASFLRQYTVNLGRSIHGGQIDVVAGKGTNVYTFDLWDGTQDYKVSDNLTNVFRIYMAHAKPLPDVTAVQCICEGYTFPRAGWNSDTVSFYSDANNFTLKLPKTEVTTIEQAKAWLAQHNVKFWYSTAENFAFTPVAINSRLGSNTLTCNNRNMKVLYRSTGTIPPEQPTLITKTVTSNGTYDADDDNADGYSSVTVNVSSGPEPTIISKTITENGVYNSQDDNADGYSTVEVNIGTPEPVEPDLDSKSITSNGTYLASDDELDGYSSVTVNVPESSFTTKTITSNGTYQASSDDVDGYSSVTVNVSSSTLTTKTITSNGSYSASSDNVDGYSNVVVNVASANLEGKTITENGTYYATDDDLDGYSAVIVNVPIPVPTLIEKTITENGTYDAEDDEADGYSSVTVNVQGAGSMSKLVYVEYVGNDANEIPTVSNMIQGTDFASYISYDSSTKKFTVLQQFTALVIPWVKQYRDASTYGEGEFYVNDVKQTWFRVQTGSTGSINGNRLWINFQEGDVFWNRTPNSNGWPQQHLKIYKCVGLPITTDTFDFYNET